MTAAAPARGRVLVVDEDALWRISVTSLLQRDYDIEVLSNGADALVRCALRPPDVVLIDPTFDDLDAAALVRGLKAESADDPLPVLVVMSGYDPRRDEILLAAGADDVMIKGIHGALLEKKVAMAVRSRQRIAAYARERQELLLREEQNTREHTMAQRVVKSLLERGCMNASFISAHLSPVSLFNGDFALAAFTREQGLRIMIGDFAGHGLSAAIGAMPVADIFYGATANGAPLAAVLRQINAKLRAILPVEIFCAATLFELDVGRKEWRVWNGGMPDLLVRHPGRSIEAVASRHLPLGILEQRDFDAAVATVPFVVGDDVFCFSDGLTELCDADGEQLGIERVRAQLAAGADFAELLETARAFRGERHAADDMTLVQVHADHRLLEVRGPRAPAPSNEGRHFRLAVDFGADLIARGGDLVGDLHALLVTLPALQPHRAELFTILAELLTNAVDYGVLRLDARLRERPERAWDYYEARERALATLTAGWVRAEMTLVEGSEAVMTLRVTDSGGASVEPREITSLSGHGRGVSLLRSLCDELRLLPAGHGVEVIKRFAIASERDDRSDEACALCTRTAGTILATAASECSHRSRAARPPS